MDGENGFKVYLAFSTGFFWDFFSFTGERCSVEFGGKVLVNFLSENSFRTSPEFRRQFQYILSRQLLSKNLIPFTGELARSFGIRSTRPITATSVRKTKFVIPISSDEKGTTSGFRVLPNHLDFLHLPLSCYSFGLLYWPLYPLLCPTLSQSVGSSWLSFWPGFVTSFNRQAEELTYIPIPLLTVNF